MRVRLGGWSVRSETGRLRKHNQDAVLGAPPLFAVADGVSSRPAGEVAAAIAITVLRAHGARSPALLHEAVFRADRAVVRAAAVDPALAGMATTLTAGLVHSGGITVVHAGHTRAYRLRGGRLELMTIDHTTARPARSSLSRYVGSGAVAPQVVNAGASPGDVWLLCSNGLSDTVDERALVDTLGSGISLYDAAHALVSLALQTGGDDVAVAVFRIV